MGLLDSVLGSVLGNQQAGSNNQESGWAGLVGTLLSNPQALQAITGLLSNDGAQGGIGGLIAKFHQAGQGEAIASWVGSGQNQAISGSQLSDALGADTMSDLAGRMGTNSGEAADQLSQLLPGLLDQLTPTGQLPAGGLGNSGDLMGVLGSLLTRR